MLTDISLWDATTIQEPDIELVSPIHHPTSRYLLLKASVRYEHDIKYLET